MGIVPLVSLTNDDINDLYLGLDVGLGPAVLLQPLDLKRKLSDFNLGRKQLAFKRNKDKTLFKVNFEWLSI